MSTERWLVTGASGQLGGHVVQQLARESADHTILALAGRGAVGTQGLEVRRIDLRDADGLRACVAGYQPTHIVHLGAMTAVADARNHPQDAERINTEATRVLAAAAAECGARLAFSSTDMVFDGQEAPYRETDPPRPLSHYGRTKLAAERALLGRDRALVVRVPLMYGFAVTRRATTFAKQVAALRSGAPLRLFTDEYRTPIWLADAARAMLGLARSDQTGLIHLAGPQRLSRYEMGQAFARALGSARAKLEGISRLSIVSPESRPADLSLDDGRFRKLFPTLVPGPVSAEAFVDPPT